ncbi:uncharacterized protein LOC124648253 [Lolium rigidum]|uniref:uncharacterized protein LOC124648253 n=1 Tax=Lolium rigidum TaxID=89674 RepID=UPI001F5DFAE6|nr:uncharacterized protein LOC124648253 [Lolium rigidum]
MATSAGSDGAVIRRAVKRLSFGASWEEKAEAAAEVGRLARSDERTKRALPELGVVPPLLSMFVDAGGEGSTGARMAAVRALLELARGTHRNKVLIVKAGLLKKLPLLMADRDLATSHDLALLLRSVSSLANTDFPLPSADLLPFLVATLSGTTADVPADTKLSCLAALGNLSANLEHVRAVAASGAVRALFTLSLDEATSEAALSVLADVAAASAAGRREMAKEEAAAGALVEAVARHENARCQEHATYLVMVLAHGGGDAGRELMRRMRRIGAVQALLEVSLLGSPLAQSRAAKILRWFKDDGKDRIRAHSGPRAETSSCHGSDGDDDGAQKPCPNAVDRIVKQSLERNMKSIMRRATASVDMTANDTTKMLVASSSSKSLPC